MPDSPPPVNERSSSSRPAGAGRHGAVRGVVRAALDQGVQEYACDSEADSDTRNVIGTDDDYDYWVPEGDDQDAQDCSPTLGGSEARPGRPSPRQHQHPVRHHEKKYRTGPSLASKPASKAEVISQPVFGLPPPDQPTQGFPFWKPLPQASPRLLEPLELAPRPEAPAEPAVPDKPRPPANNLLATSAAWSAIEDAGRPRLAPRAPASSTVARLQARTADSFGPKRPGPRGKLRSLEKVYGSQVAARAAPGLPALQANEAESLHSQLPESDHLSRLAPVNS